MVSVFILFYYYSFYLTNKMQFMQEKDASRLSFLTIDCVCKSFLGENDQKRRRNKKN
jgi:hypothetical protein